MGHIIVILAAKGKRINLKFFPVMKLKEFNKQKLKEKHLCLKHVNLANKEKLIELLVNLQEHKHKLRKQGQIKWGL